MDKKIFGNDNVENSLDIGSTSARAHHETESSDEDESYKSCADPFSTSAFPQVVQEETENKEGEEVIDPEQENVHRSYPPDISDDSDNTFSENGSEDIYYSEIDNNENESDISNPHIENSSNNADQIEISFQRELLDYLGSFFNVESRFRMRENRHTMNVSDDEIGEYGRLRTKVNQDLKVLGVGNHRELASSDQNIARNLYYLLAARERGDWTSCRRYSRFVPMWSFEKREKMSSNVNNDVNLIVMEKESLMVDHREMNESRARVMGDEWDHMYTVNKVVFNKKEGGRDRLKETTTTEDITLVDNNYCEDNPINEKIYCQSIDQLDNKNYEMKDSIEEKPDLIEEKSDCIEEKPDCQNTNIIMQTNTMIELADEVSDNNLPHTITTPANNNMKREKLIFKNITPVKYLSDEIEKCVETRSEKILLSKMAMRDETEVISCERVQRNGIWDIKSAVYGSRWSVRRLGLECRFSAHEGCVNALDFSISGNWIASGSDDKHLVITDWQRRKQLSRFKVGHSSNIFQVRFLPGSNDLELVSCSRDSSVRYAALSSTGQLQYSRVLAKHKDCCHKMDVPIDQPCLVISAGEDTRVLGSDVRAPQSKGKICKVDKVPLYTISCSPVRSQEFAVAGKDSRVFIYDRRKASSYLHQLCPENLYSKPRSSYHVTSVAYSKNGESILASYNDDDIYLLSTWPKNNEPVSIHRYQGHRNVQTVTGVSFYGPQHEYVVSGSNDGHVLLWERDTEALVNWFRADEIGVVNVLEPHPSMPILATAGLDHDIKLWSMIAADGETDRGLPLDLPLLERDAETSRIDYAWKKLDEKLTNSNEESSLDNHVPFNLRNLRVITALNWKMREESYPYSIDNNLDNLIFMSRRRPGENQFRGIFISDSDSADSYDSIPDLNSDNGAGGSFRNGNNDNPNYNASTRSNRDASDTNRPDGCRSS